MNLEFLIVLFDLPVQLALQRLAPLEYLSNQVMKLQSMFFN